MATPIVSSSRSNQYVDSEQSLITPETLVEERRSWAKRLMTGAARHVKNNRLLYPAIVRGFRALQRLGINVTPNHSYWPVPDVAELEKREWPIYAAPPGCNFDLREQVELARHFGSRYVPELEWGLDPTDGSYHYHNGYFESCDAEVAYCMVRDWKPRRIMEIGSGCSTRAMAQALRENLLQDGILGELTTIDPSPERLPGNGLGDFVTVIARPVQHLDIGLFKTLRADDILFIDSSHVVSVGSDVVREYLEILPQLKPGVLIHFHDIFLPADYPRKLVVEDLSFWSEQYLLQAFLAFNPEFEVLWAASAMQLSHASILEQCFPKWANSYREMPASKRRFVPTPDSNRVWPSSFWMRRVMH